MLYQVLRRLFKNFNSWFPFLATVLFLAHPIHSEVVNSLYYRDILLAFLFSFLAIDQFLKWVDTGKRKNMVIGSLSFFLALLSNESVLVFTLLFPLILYFFSDASKSQLTKLFLAELAIAVIGIVLPLLFLPFNENPILHYENPLVSETNLQISTGFYTLAWYLKMLFYPNPLSFYYGYDILPLAGWSNIFVWLSLTFFTGITVFSFISLKNKNILSFLVLFFIISILPYSNLFAPVRGIVGERFLFLPSVAFSIFLVWIFFKIFKINSEKSSQKTWKITSISLLVLLLAIPSQLITKERNKVWKTDIILYRNDVTIYPQSAFINNILGRERLKPVVIEMAKEVSPYKFIISDIKEVENFSKAAVAIDSTLSESWERLGYVSAEIHGWMAVRRMESYSNQKKEVQSEMEEANAAEFIGKANIYYNNALKYNCTDSAFIYFRKATSFRIIYQFDSSLVNFEQAISLEPENLQFRNEYVQTLLKAGKFREALVANDQLMKRFPESDVAYINLAGYQYFAGDTISAVKNYEIAIQKGTRRPEVGKFLYYYYKNNGNAERANYFLERSYEAEKAAAKK
jgi:Flp pilus assembly protein TadD